MRKAEELLEQPVSVLALSESFTNLCRQMGFEKIADIVALKPDELIRRHGFTFHWLSELISFLEENKALHLLQARLIKENISG